MFYMNNKTFLSWIKRNILKAYPYERPRTMQGKNICNINTMACQMIALLNIVLTFRLASFSKVKEKNTDMLQCDKEIDFIYKSR